MKTRIQRGATLIELMVALLIGSVLVLGVFSIMSIFEGRRRTVDASSDLDQSGNVAMFQLDEWVRSAGTGLVQASAYAFGCELFAARSGNQILPATSPLPAPFAGVDPGASGVFRLAPALILPGQTTPGVSAGGSKGASSDVLVLMSAGGGYGQVPALFSAAPTGPALSLVNTVAFAPGDLLLLADQQPSADGVAPCLVSQVDSAFVPTAPAASTAGGVTTLPLGGAWYAASVKTAAVAGFTANAAAIGLGNVAATPPRFQLVGVGDNDTLFTYDLLHATDTPLQARAEGVFELHALYGVDTDNDGKVDRWVKADSGDYAVGVLAAGDAKAASLLKTIRALRVGLIMRTSLPESKAVPTSRSVTLFSDLGDSLAFVRPLAAAEQVYRYRALEATIPLRNNSF